jgi:hypothetical protein
VTKAHKPDQTVPGTKPMEETAALEAVQLYQTLAWLVGAVLIALKGAVIALWFAWRNERKYRYRIEKEFRDFVIRSMRLLPRSGPPPEEYP